MSTAHQDKIDQTRYRAITHASSLAHAHPSPKATKLNTISFATPVPNGVGPLGLRRSLHLLHVCLPNLNDNDSSYRPLWAIPGPRTISSISSSPRHAQPDLLLDVYII
jgi:hypothetical protein